MPPSCVARLLREALHVAHRVSRVGPSYFLLSLAVSTAPRFDILLLVDNRASAASCACAGAQAIPPSCVARLLREALHVAHPLSHVRSSHILLSLAVSNLPQFDVLLLVDNRSCCGGLMCMCRCAGDPSVMCCPPAARGAARGSPRKPRGVLPVPAVAACG
jgi:hypothetical protein